MCKGNIAWIKHLPPRGPATDRICKLIVISFALLLKADDFASGGKARLPHPPFEVFDVVISFYLPSIFSVDPILLKVPITSLLTNE
jgi:hypothetical protein